MRLLASCTALVSAVVVVAQNPPKDEGFTVTKATILMLGWDQQDIWGSIIAAGPTATTYSLDFYNDIGVDKEYYEDGSIPSTVVTAGPSTFHMVLSGVYSETTFQYTSDCTLTASAQGECSLTELVVSGTQSSTHKTIANFDSSEYSSALQVVTITAGPAPAPASPTPTTTTPQIVSSLQTSSKSEASGSTANVVQSIPSTTSSIASSATSSPRASQSAAVAAPRLASGSVVGLVVAVMAYRAAM